MNTGGPAFPVPDTHHPSGQVQFGTNGMTLLDWFAGQALAGSLASQSKESHWVFATVEDETADDRATKGVADLCYDIAAAMLAEKARREAVVQASQTTDHSGDANKMVEDHFPDATEMTELEERNKELVEKVKRLENAGNDLVWWFCQKESSQLSHMQSASLKQWRDLRGRRNP